MLKDDIYFLRLLRDHKKAKLLPIWKLMPISKCWIGYPTAKYVIWWGTKILDHADTYRGAIKLRREIWNRA